MPGEVLAEFGNWRKIRDWQGTEGWVHQSMLSGRRYAIVTGEIRALHRQADPAAPAGARVEPRGGAQNMASEDPWGAGGADGVPGWRTPYPLCGCLPRGAVQVHH